MKVRWWSVYVEDVRAIHVCDKYTYKSVANRETTLTGGGSPGLMVMGGDSCSEGCGFKSQHYILDGHFSTFICVKFLLFV